MRTRKQISAKHGRNLSHLTAIFSSEHENFSLISHAIVKTIIRGQSCFIMCTRELIRIYAYLPPPPLPTYRPSADPNSHHVCALTLVTELQNFHYAIIK